MSIIAYLDLPSGLSGDMFLSCLIDAGWNIDDLRRTIAALPLPPNSIEISAESIMRGPFRATLISVKTAETTHRRNLDDIRQILAASTLSQSIKDRALATFTRLAHAEAAVHGTTPDQIHFHEVGALDSIADITGVIAGLEAMHIDRLYASALPVASGWIGSAHGALPLPAPATLQLLASVNAPIRPAPSAAPAHVHVHKSDNFSIHHNHAPTPPAEQSKAPQPTELVTPTAAALLAELATFQQPEMRLHRIGIGAGQRIFAWPNIARLWLGEPDAAGPIIQIDTNIDDMNPQLYDPAMQRLFAAGALDVWLTPIQMKKNRPAITLSVLAPASLETEIADILLRQTTTLGLRIHHVRRHEAQREFRTVQTPHGPVKLKLKLKNGRIISAAPEYEDCKKLADTAAVPVNTIYECAQSAARELLG